MLSRGRDENMATLGMGLRVLPKGANRQRALLGTTTLAGINNKCEHRFVLNGRTPTCIRNPAPSSSQSGFFDRGPDASLRDSRIHLRLPLSLPNETV